MMSDKVLRIVVEEMVNDVLREAAEKGGPKGHAALSVLCHRDPQLAADIVRLRRERAELASRRVYEMKTINPKQSKRFFDITGV